VSKIDSDENLILKENFLQKIFVNFKKFQYQIIIASCLLIFGLMYYFL